MSVDTLVIGGLNEGSWPRRAEADRFMSRLMKSGLDLEPPERRIGQAAHDFVMALGTKQVILTRSARAGEAPAVPSRWLQRLTTFAGKEAVDAMRGRGRQLLAWASELDAGPQVRFAARPQPKPPLAVAPGPFLGDRDRDAAPRSLRDLCAADSQAEGARPAAARSGRGRAGHAVPRDPASLFRVRHRSARPGRAWMCCWRRAGSVLPRRRCRRMSRLCGGRASSGWPTRSSPGSARAPRT